MQKIEEMKTDAWFSRICKKLKASDWEIISSFLLENDKLEPGLFELKVNRMFLDVQKKPKNWTRIQELLSNSNPIIRRNFVHPLD